MATANQPGTGRPWFLRLASQARIDQPQPPPPQPQPQPSPPVRPTAPPPPRGPPIRQASLALGRPPLVTPPAPTQPPPAALTQTTPPPASTNGTAFTTPAEAPRSAREASPAPPPPSPGLSTNGTAVATPADAPRSARAASPAPTNGTAVATTLAEAPRSARPPSPAPPPPSPRTTTRSSPTPPQSPRVVIPATPSSSRGFSFPNLQPEPMPAATAAEKDSRTGTKVLGNGAINGGNSFKQQNSTSPLAPPPKNDEKSSTADVRGWAPTKNKKNIEKEMAGVTIAGHNVGAFMDIGSSYSHQIRRQQYQHVNGKSEFEDLRKSSATATEFGAAAGDPKQKPWFSRVNSNVQSVNNSMLLNTACVQGSPGVHISVGGGRSRRQLKNGGYFSDQKKTPSASSSPR